MNECDTMKKLAIPLSVVCLMIFSTLSFNSIDVLEPDRYENSNTSSSTSSDLDLLLSGEGLIRLVNNDVDQHPAKFTVIDSVMDSEGSTYVVGNLRDAGIVLDNLPRVNLNDDLSRNAERSSPIVAKMDSNGAWEWMYYPIPEKGDKCYAESFLEINESYAFANSISLSSDESTLSFVGEFTGCYDFGSNDYIYNGDPVPNGYITNLNTTYGSFEWVLSIQHEEVSPSFGAIYLTSVSHSPDSENSNIYVTGSLQSLTINPTSSASGVNTLKGDDNGDAYFAVITTHGELLYQEDSCSNNDDNSGGGCNTAASERGISLDVYEDSVMIGVEVDSDASSVRIFGSQAIANPPSKINTLAWEIDADTFAPASLSAIDLNGAASRDYQISDSIVVDGQLTYLVQQSFSEGENLPMDIVNIEKDTTKTIQGGDTGSSFVVHGFVHGEYFGTHLLVSWFNPSPRTLSWSGDDGTSGTLNLVQGTHLVSVDDLSDVVNINLPFHPSSKIRIANNHLHHSSMFSLDLQGTHNTGNVYLHDTDGDSIPDYFDTNAFIPSDLDSDSDGIVDTRDNCPYYWNQDQSDFDDDGDGDVCDDDVDNDGVSNNQPIDFTGSDECPFENSSAQDLDGDGCIDEQNNTVSDTDGDGVLDDSDTCPGDDLEDMDGDGIPDDCDNFPQDWDNDGVDDETDACQGFDDNNDSDDDGIPLGCDDFPNDTDNDGITNNADNCIFIVNPNQANMDGDAQGDACDADIDGDNITNVAPIHVSIGTSQDSCPYVDATGKDEDRDGCIDEIKPDKCEICKEPVEGNETNTLLDPDDVTTVAAVGGAGAVGGGALAFVLSKLRRATRFIGIDDGLEALKHLPKRKKEDAGSDHYFQRGLVRQREMTLSADKNLDDYIEENEKEGVEKK